MLDRAGEVQVPDPPGPAPALTNTQRWVLVITASAFGLMIFSVIPWSSIFGASTGPPDDQVRHATATAPYWFEPRPVSQVWPPAADGSHVTATMHAGAPASWRVYLGVGLALAVSVLTVPVGLVRDVVYVAIGMSCAAAILVGVHRAAPTNRRAWYLLATGCVAWVLGDAIYSWYADVALSSPFPSAADVCYLAAYPLLAGALFSLVRSRGREHSIAAALDSAILLVGLGLLSWVFLVSPTWSTAGLPLLDRAVLVAYPLGDVLVLAVLIRLSTASGHWNGAGRLLGGSFVVVLVTDSIFEAAQVVPALSGVVPALDAGWLAAYVLWGAAALHPSMDDLSAPGPTVVGSITRGRLAALMVTSLSVPAVIAGELVVGGRPHLWPVLVAAGVIIPLVFARIARMMSQLHDQAERLAHLANTDPVTGLPNRRGFTDQLEAMLASPGPGAVLMMVDLERFTQVNDALGHRTGDAILAGVGRRLVQLAGPGALVGRMGGDAFAVFDPAGRCGPSADTACVRFREALEKPYRLADLDVAVQVAVGLLDVAPGGTAPTLALNRADSALTEAKTRPGRIARYDGDLDALGSLSTELLSELGEALERGEIMLHYQPQIALATGRVFAVEALARWRHPRHGLLGPDLFIPAAEQTGMIGPLTHYVLNEAVSQAASWRSQGLMLTVAVNLSTRNLLDPGLVDDVHAALTLHQFPATALELEITESSAMVDPRRSVEVLGILSSSGVRLSIDDYGTGHSSLAYLQHLPVRSLKIDRSFVTDLLHDHAASAIVASTIELARQLNLTTVAEGVEDDATLLALHDLHCDAVQGFGIGRPVPASQVPDLIVAIERRLPILLTMGSAHPDARAGTLPSPRPHGSQDVSGARAGRAPLGR